MLRRFIYHNTEKLDHLSRNFITASARNRKYCSCRYTDYFIENAKYGFLFANCETLESEEVYFTNPS